LFSEAVTSSFQSFLPAPSGSFHATVATVATFNWRSTTRQANPNQVFLAFQEGGTARDLHEGRFVYPSTTKK
jgi:hypothetical protein